MKVRQYLTAKNVHYSFTLRSLSQKAYFSWGKVHWFWDWIITIAATWRKIVIKYDSNLQYRQILSNVALSLAKQSLTNDNRPDQKWILKNISEIFLISPSRSSRLFSRDG